MILVFVLYILGSIVIFLVFLRISGRSWIVEGILVEVCVEEVCDMRFFGFCNFGVLFLLGFDYLVIVIFI